MGHTALMPRNLALALLAIASSIAAGCGSDDSEPSPGGQSGAREVQKAEPKAKSVRAQMIDCIERELGYDVTTGEDPHKLSIKSSNGKRQAVVVIHPDAAAARKAVARTLSKELNAVVFGRAELILDAARDTEAGIIANCVAGGYNRPRQR